MISVLYYNALNVSADREEETGAAGGDEPAENFSLSSKCG